ncbi:hypothetical protein H8959_001244 [Pygathrix nigripes]
MLSIRKKIHWKLGQEAAAPPRARAPGRREDSRTAALSSHPQSLWMALTTAKSWDNTSLHRKVTVDSPGSRMQPRRLVAVSCPWVVFMGVWGLQAPPAPSSPDEGPC